MSKKPAIGITKPDNEDRLAYLAISNAVRITGGKPVKITPSSNYQNYDIKAVILGGGKDVFPELYKQASDPAYQYDHARDQMEIYWARRALENNIPALGICRGAQLMNVTCQGTLHNSVAEAYEDAIYPDGLFHNIFYRKQSLIIKETLLHGIVKQDILQINSIHKQAIDELGEGLVINAKERNQVIQAISHINHPFFLGVQFHPELLIYQRKFRDIFSALILAAQS